MNHFVVELRMSYADRNVPGATSIFGGRGELDILNPGNATFHGFHLDLARLDLRTPQFLSAGFPRLNGVLAGTATLDSVWTDVRFSDADITHTDGDSTPPTRLRGDGRVTSGGVNIGFDLAVAALPLSLNTLARSWPDLPVRGEYTGPIRLQGDATDFSATADLVGDAGRLQLEGRFGATSGFRVSSRGSVAGFDLKRVMARAGMPSTSLNGRFVTSLEGDSLANMLGEVQFSADRSLVMGSGTVRAGQRSLCRRVRERIRWPFISTSTRSAGSASISSRRVRSAIRRPAPIRTQPRSPTRSAAPSAPVA